MTHTKKWWETQGNRPINRLIEHDVNELRSLLDAEGQQHIDGHIRSNRHNVHEVMTSSKEAMISNELKIAYEKKQRYFNEGRIDKAAEKVIQITMLKQLEAGNSLGPNDSDRIMRMASTDLDRIGVTPGADDVRRIFERTFNAFQKHGLVPDMAA